MERKETQPYCFGKLENVFPKGANDLRHTPESCWVCGYKTGCLRSALGQPDGIRTKEESMDRAYQSGMIGFWERWSRKKTFHRRIKKLEQEEERQESE